MLQDSKLITWTYSRNNVGKTDKYLDSESKEVLYCIENVFGDDAPVISNSINDMCNNIFENESDVDDIDITIRLIDEKLYIVFTTDGTPYNPFSNDKLMKSDNMVKLSELNCQFDYDEILGFNKSYLILDN